MMGKGLKQLPLQSGCSKGPQTLLALRFMVDNRCWIVECRMSNGMHGPRHLWRACSCNESRAKLQTIVHYHA